MSTQPVKFGYFNLQGRGQVSRLLFAYTETPFNETTYTFSNIGQWLQNDKINMGLDFPSLPYLIDGKLKLTESRAVEKYIIHRAKKTNQLLGSNSKQKALIDNIDGVLKDIFEPIIGLFFTNTFEQERKRIYPIIQKKLQILDAFIGPKSHFLNRVTYPDFTLTVAYEYVKLFFPHQYGQWKNVQRVYNYVNQLPQVVAYYNSNAAVEDVVAIEKAEAPIFHNLKPIKQQTQEKTSLQQPKQQSNEKSQSQKISKQIPVPQLSAVLQTNLSQQHSTMKRTQSTLVEQEPTQQPLSSNEQTKPSNEEVSQLPIYSNYHKNATDQPLGTKKAQSKLSYEEISLLPIQSNYHKNVSEHQQMTKKAQSKVSYEEVSQLPIQSNYQKNLDQQHEHFKVRRGQFEKAVSETETVELAKIKPEDLPKQEIHLNERIQQFEKAVQATEIVELAEIKPEDLPKQHLNEKVQNFEKAVQEAETVQLAKIKPEDLPKQHLDEKVENFEKAVQESNVVELAEIKPEDLPQKETNLNERVENFEKSVSETEVVELAQIKPEDLPKQDIHLNERVEKFEKAVSETEVVELAEIKPEDLPKQEIHLNERVEQLKKSVSETEIVELAKIKPQDLAQQIIVTPSKISSSIRPNGNLDASWKIITESQTISDKQQKKSSITLGYWGVRGLGQIQRHLLAYCDHEFTQDIYVSREQWLNKDKQSLGLAFPNLPYLISGDLHITESLGIDRYIIRTSKKQQLLGKNLLDETLIENVIKILSELFKQLRVLCFTDQPQQMKKQLSTKIDTILKRLNELNKNNEHLLSYLTWADFYLAEISHYIEQIFPEIYKQYQFLANIRHTIEKMNEVQTYYQRQTAIKAPFMPPTAKISF